MPDLELLSARNFLGLNKLFKCMVILLSDIFVTISSNTPENMVVFWANSTEKKPLFLGYHRNRYIFDAYKNDSRMDDR